jgi:hypothetical protein
MIDCLDGVCACLLHDSNLGPTLPAGGMLAVFAAPALGHFAREQACGGQRVTASGAFRKHSAHAAKEGHAGERTLQSHSVMLPRRIHSTRGDALAFPSASNITTSSWF